MSAGGTAFVRRALLFIDAARAGRYPNAPWLAEQEEVSVPTARRVINRLRDDFGAPLMYSDADRGWELTDQKWVFPATDLAPRSEMIALAFALDVGRTVSDPGIEEALETFALRLAERLGTTRLGVDELLTSFSSDRTDRSVLADPLVIDVVEAVAQRREVRFDYASPWKQEPAAERAVKPLHVRCVDGAPYLLGIARAGERVFNLAFVENLVVTDERFDPPADAADRDWAESFGVWSGREVVDVCARIGPPASRYFAGQQWHPGQQDTWDGEVLQRRFAGHVSPELVRRLLGLGGGLMSVEPEGLRAAVVAEASGLIGNLRRQRPDHIPTEPSE